MFGNYYASKKVLVTGHSGFKGAWLSLWLRHLGASVYGFGWEPPTNPNLFELLEPADLARDFRADIRSQEELRKALLEVRPDLVFHLAAQPLVRRSYLGPAETFDINVGGTINLLETVRKEQIPCAVIVVTSDKCYRNLNWEYGYRESDPLGGFDVYSMSKAAAEMVVEAWRCSFFQPAAGLGPITSVRAGNVIGGGDYAEDRIVPDCIRALLRNEPIAVRKPLATRPWQHVLDCLSGYLWLGARLGMEPKSSILASPFNFGPNASSNVPVRDLVEEILTVWPGAWLDKSNPLDPHEASRLHLATDKAAHHLQWFPTWDFKKSVQATTHWYHRRHVQKDPNMRTFTLAQIEDFMNAGAQQKQAWALPPR